MGKRISVKSRDLSVNSVDTGSPHVVIPISEAGARGGLEAVDVVRLGRTIRYHREFTPSGTNVNFIERSRGNTIRIRTYERGVEDETLACGTGSIASAIVAKRLWGLKAPVRVIPRSGVPLLVNFRGEDAISDVCLTGPAKAVFSGSFEL